MIYYVIFHLTILLILLIIRIEENIGNVIRLNNLSKSLDDNSMNNFVKNNISDHLGQSAL